MGKSTISMAIVYVANCKRLHFQYLEDHPTATARLVRPNRDDIIDVGTQKILFTTGGLEHFSHTLW